MTIYGIYISFLALLRSDTKSTYESLFMIQYMKSIQLELSNISTNVFDSPADLLYFHNGIPHVLFPVPHPHHTSIFALPSVIYSISPSTLSTYLRSHSKSFHFRRGLNNSFEVPTGFGIFEHFLRIFKHFLGYFYMIFCYILGFILKKMYRIFSELFTPRSWPAK